MPLYEFRCTQGHAEERLRRYENRDEPLTCVCGLAMQRVFSRAHCAPDGVYSYAPNIGDADRFERQRQAIKDGTKVLARTPDVPREHRDGQISGRRP